jgi:hypothetical protein
MDIIWWCAITASWNYYYRLDSLIIASVITVGGEPLITSAVITVGGEPLITSAVITVGGEPLITSAVITVATSHHPNKVGLALYQYNYYYQDQHEH